MSGSVYKFGVVGDDEIMECDSCTYPAPLRTFDSHTEAAMRNGGPLATERRNLCEICAASPVGTHTAYPRQHPEYSTTVVVAYCTNSILDQLGKFADAPVVRVDSVEELEIP